MGSANLQIGILLTTRALDGNGLHQQRSYPSGFIPSDARSKALEQLDRMLADQAARSQELSALLTWELIGPRPTMKYNGALRTSGTTKSIAVDPRDANTVYIGAPDGGVWKTIDG